jgi:hypothetical protein
MRHVEHSIKKKSRKGRIIQMRLGINPNSSGHGILWASLFFLPFSVILLLVYPVEKQLAAALERYRLGTVRRRFAPEMLPVWLLAWSGFSFLWAYLITSLEPRQAGQLLPAALVLAAVVVLVVVLLLYRCRHQPGLPELSRKAALTALFGALAMVLFLLLFNVFSFPLHVCALAVLLIYLSLTTLLLAAGTLKLSGLLGKRGMLFAAGIYIATGFLSIIPVIPVPADSLNPVGAGFFVWGPGAPFVATVAGLLRLGGVDRADPENSF